MSEVEEEPTSDSNEDEVQSEAGASASDAEEVQPAARSKAAQANKGM